MEADQINSSSPFNDEGEQFNADAEITNRTLRFLSQVREEEVSITKTDPSRQQTLRFVDPDRAARVEQQFGKPIPRQPFVCGFAVGRAIRTNQQHRAGLWSENGAVRLLAENNTNDPSEADLQQGWEDLQLFSYLPPALQVSEDVYRDMARPRKRQAVLRDALLQQGLNASANREDVGVGVQYQDNPELLPPATPFSNNRLSICEERLRNLIEGRIG
jgi:hypothetical protein